LKIKVAALCPWRDMHTRLSAIEKQGGLVNQCAARAALLAPDSVAVAARSLDEEASHLINTGIQLTKMNYDPGSGAFLGGEMEKQPDFKKFDESIQSFERAVADEIGQADQTRN
jgi:hypothetical protein